MNSIFEHKVRVRVCGILIEQDQVLMLKHRGVGPGGYLWSPPGGGLEFGEDAQQAIAKEFIEETGLEVIPVSFLFVNEYRDDRFHAVELFFQVEKTGGQLKLGYDPELASTGQILEQVQWLSAEDIMDIDKKFMHNVFHDVKSLDAVLGLRGFFKFANISIK